MPFRILIADDEIDDETNEISKLPDALRAAGYEVQTTTEANLVRDLVSEYMPDLVVLDIVFKGQSLNGIKLCEVLRQDGCQAPILFVTALLMETEDTLQLFKAGASDFVSSPQDNQEILARIRANLPPEVTVVDNTILADFVGRRVWICQDGRWQRVRLPRLQYELLQVLVSNAGAIVPITVLKDRVFGKPVPDSALAIYVHRLRGELEPEPREPVYIEAIQGIGYRFNGKITHASLTLLDYGCGGNEEVSSNG